MEAYSNGGCWKLVAEFTEIEGGNRLECQNLAEAVGIAKKHEASLVVAKLDRLSRNVAFVADPMEVAVDFVAHAPRHKLTPHPECGGGARKGMISRSTRATPAAATINRNLLANLKSPIDFKGFSIS